MDLKDRVAVWAGLLLRLCAAACRFGGLLWAGMYQGVCLVGLTGRRGITGGQQIGVDNGSSREDG